MGGGLPFQRGVHRQHDLVDPASGNAPHELVDGEILRADPVERRQSSAKHMISAREESRSIQCPKIRDFFDNAQHLLVAARIAADRTGIGRVDIAANRAGGKFFGDVLERREQRLKRGLALLHQVQHRAPRRTRAEARQTRQRLR